LHELAEQALTLLYPLTCVLCGAPGVAGRDLCAGCHADLPHLGSRCAICAQPFATPRDQALEPRALAPSAERICARCQRQAPPFDRCRAAFRYEDPLPAVVAGIKFQSKLNLIRLLGELLADALQAEAEQPNWQRPDAILPVPLHPTRLRQRGYNQALELAKVVGRRLQIPVNHRCCRRTRATQAQSELDERLRLSNIRGAFEAVSGIPKRLAILDDVVTTGATVSELARVLRRAGCAQIEVWSLARTP
jgi:ComF family protein